MVVVDTATKFSKPSRFAHFWQGAQSTAPATRNERPKVVRTSGAFNNLTWKCASRYSGLRFWTSQLPKVVRDHQFLTLLTWIRASRHNGAHLFDLATSKSGPKLRCLVHFDLEMCFWPQRRAIVHLSSHHMAPAPAALASLLFDPPEPQINGKTQWIETFLPFRAPASSFFSLFLLSDLLSSSLLLSDSSHLCFSNCPCCRKFHF